MTSDATFVRPVLRLALATANPGKVAELRTILGGHPAIEIELVDRPAEAPDVVEDSGTLVGNARLKAAAIAAVAGMPALADDTGLEVDALDGAPGVETAYFAGPDATDADNRSLMLAELADFTEPAERTARFRTVAMVVWPDGRELWVDGVCDGSIAIALRGARGFGYDPLFVPADGDGRSFAEMSGEEKAAISHRGRAFRALLDRLAAELDVAESQS